MTAIALLSGGLDSTVAATLYRRDVGPLQVGLFVDYGQRAVRPEEAAARAVGETLGIEIVVTRVELLEAITTTALVSRQVDLPQPELDRLDADAAASADAVWVPNRNGVLVNLAAALAEARGAEHVVVGFNAEEAESFPDNSTRFLDSLNRCLEDSTRGRVSVVCPTRDLTKAQLLAAGREAGAPIDLTWSCYEDGSRPCGRCESCVRRQRAIERAATPE